MTTYKLVEHPFSGIGPVDVPKGEYDTLEDAKARLARRKVYFETRYDMVGEWLDDEHTRLELVDPDDAVMASDMAGITDIKIINDEEHHGDEEGDWEEEVTG
jgi:hypothetical protein